METPLFDILRKVQVCNTQRASVAHEINAWAASLAGAWRKSSARWAQALAILADTRAKELEATVATSKAAMWRAAVGDPNSKPAATRPAKLAYRWVKGLAGWTRSPIGSIIANDAVPDDDLDDIDAEQPDGQQLVPSNSDIECSQVPLSDLCTDI